MDLKDLILTPFFIIIIYLFGYWYRRRIKDKTEKKYFIPALSMKISGALMLGLIYQFFYTQGDTFNFVLLGSQHIYEAFFDSPYKAFLLFIDDGNYNYPEVFTYISKIYYYRDPSSYLIVKIAAFISLFCFNTYSVIAICFGLFSFSGSIALYRTFIKIYPGFNKSSFLAIFFIPSVFFWGSGLLKDSITFGALCWLIYAFANIFLFKFRILSSIIVLLISAYLIKTIKIYILLCTAPALVIWLFLHFSYFIRSSLLRSVIKPVLIIFAVVTAYLATDYISRDNKRYSFDNLAETAKVTSEWLTYMSKLQGGSYYTLGPMDKSLTGMIQKAPAAIWVTLFRPYLWESKNIVMLISASESFLFLLLTLYVIFKTGIFQTLNILRNDPFLIYSLIFSMAFAFAIGISTYNFGSLVRYKIPLLPFYLLMLVVVYEKGKRRNNLKRISSSKPVNNPENQIINV